MRIESPSCSAGLRNPSGNVTLPSIITAAYWTLLRRTRGAQEGCVRKNAPHIMSMGTMRVTNGHVFYLCMYAVMF